MAWPVIGEGRARASANRSPKSGTLRWDTHSKKPNDQVGKLASHHGTKPLRPLNSGTSGEASIRRGHLP